MKKKHYTNKQHAAMGRGKVDNDSNIRAERRMVNEENIIEEKIDSLQ